MKSRMQLSKHGIFWSITVILFGALIAGIAFHQGLLSKHNPHDLSHASEREPLVRPATPPADFVGGMACKRCHQAIWERYQSHPMAQTSARIEDAAPIEDFEHDPSFKVATPIGEMEYRVERLQGKQFHHESLTDPELGLIYDQAVAMDFVIGSGRRARSYLLVKNDCLFMSPIGWYSQGMKWDMSPSYPAGNHPRFERRITQACVVCHASRVSATRDEPQCFPPPGILEAGISCERCHGPGAGHIAFHDQRTDQTGQSSLGNDPIVNPIKLDSNRRESVCWQCHLSAEEREPRYGRVDSDFRPGMNYDEVWVAFVSEQDRDDNAPSRAVSHVQQTLASKCFQQSNGRFGCLSCHDPHSVPSSGDRESFYREKCLSCHADRGCSVPVEERIQRTETDSCVTCHMPSERLKTIPHTSQTDHRVLRKPSTEPAIPGETRLAIFSYGGRQLPQVEQDRAWGMILAKAAERRKDHDLAFEATEKLASVQSLVPDDNDVLEWLGASEALLGRNERARVHWTKILNADSRNEGVLRRLADLNLTQGNLPAARDLFVRYLEINPWQSDYQARLAAVYGRLGNFEAAIQSANESLKVNPTLAWAHGILIEVYQRQGNQLEARRHLQLYRKLDRTKQVKH